MKRLAPVVLLIMSVASCGGSSVITKASLDQAKFEPVHRAGRATREACAIGVSLVRMRELAANYATEVSLASDKAGTDLEKQFVALHSGALQAYRASLTVWDEKIEQSRSGRVCSNVSQSSMMLTPVIDEYALPGEKLSDTAFCFQPDPAIQKIWGQADGKLAIADAIYSGQTEVAGGPSSVAH